MTAPCKQPLEVRARRRQRAARARLERDVPLLLHSGILRPPTLEEAAEQVVAHDVQAAAVTQGVADLVAEMEQRGQALRAQLAVGVTADELAALDRKRAALPRSGEYTADFWQRESKRGGGR